MTTLYFDLMKFLKAERPDIALEDTYQALEAILDANGIHRYLKRREVNAIHRAQRIILKRMRKGG